MPELAPGDFGLILETGQDDGLETGIEVNRGPKAVRPTIAADASAPFRCDLLLPALGKLGTGTKAIKVRCDQGGAGVVVSVVDDADPTSSFDLVGMGQRVVASCLQTETVQQAVAENIVTHMFLPLMAIAECSSVVPDSDSDCHSDSDSDVDVDVSYTRRGGRKRAPASDDAPVQTYIFPPSPLTNMDDDDNDDAPDSARHLAHYLTHFLDPHAVALLQRAARDTVANSIALPRTWSERFRRFETAVEPSGGLALSGTTEGMAANEWVVRPLHNPLSNPTDEPLQEPWRLPTRPGPLARELLCLHARIAHVLHTAEAIPYMDRLLADSTRREDLAVDGETMAGVLMSLRLDGWYHSRSRRRGQGRCGASSDEGSFVGVWTDDAQFVEEQ
ncbi:hypothetical protein HMPREF1624_08288 [Sporothrix schenckii ATCC 58251]|uniref:HNH nuclease domain-containing protein n=1 Tax=Sporothrix schenckii (strain ATCC 58251 / de Perez 2211183) TaxID=1391915 RepID=U7PLP5_SPOS1|nr:hypothetical protein HMPREF1624_08288 [Sporothrix schenckii ATCC 58251]